MDEFKPLPSTATTVPPAPPVPPAATLAADSAHARRTDRASTSFRTSIKDRVNDARYVIGCRSTQETIILHVADNVALAGQVIPTRHTTLDSRNGGLSCGV
jgi:hypothetical protein